MKSNITKKIFRGFILLVGRAASIYLIIACLLFGIVNQRRVAYNNLNYLSYTADYVSEFAKGDRKFEEVIFRKAIVYFKNLLDLEPQSSGVFSALGYCYYQLGDYSKSFQYYQIALDAESKGYGMDHNLGVVLFTVEKYEEAIESFIKEINTLTDKMQPFRLVDPYRKMLVQPDIEYLKIKMEKCYMYMVISYQNLKNFEKMHESALLGLRNATLHKDHFLYYAGLAAYHMKSYKKAVYYLRESNRLNPKLTEPYTLLTKILQQNNLDSEEQFISQLHKKLLESGDFEGLEIENGQRALYYLSPVQFYKENGKILRVVL